MFVRRKNNPSGSISITVVDKSRGRYDVVRSFGTVKTAAEADLLENKAREWVREQEGDPETLFDQMDEEQLRAYAATLQDGRIELAGPELLYGELFDRLQLGNGRYPLFRHLVIDRLADPVNKLRVIGYLERYLGGSAVSPEEVYAAVDHLYLTEITVSQAIPVAAVLFPTPLARTPFCLLTDADGRPVAGRLMDRKAIPAGKGEKAVQRLARKYGAASPVRIRKGSDVPPALPAVFRMSKKDLSVRPMRRRKRGRVEGHFCVCLAAYAVQVELERLLRASGSSVTSVEVREAARSLFRLNYISPYTRRPKSVLLQMTPLQKQLFDLIHS